jgi:phospholipid transport system substrate-binding protein
MQSDEMHGALASLRYGPAAGGLWWWGRVGKFWASSCFRIADQFSSGLLSARIRTTNVQYERYPHTATNGFKSMTPARRVRAHILACVLIVFAAAPLKVCAQSEAKKIVQDVATRILERIAQDRQRYQENPKLLYDVVLKDVGPYFDFQSMSKLALGERNWQGADAIDREAFILEFRDLLVRTYSSVLLQYRSEDLAFLKSEILDKRGLIERVQTQVKRGGGQPPSLVDFVVVRGTPGWQVVDVLVDGVSMVTVQSASFQEVIRRDGLRKLVSDLHRFNSARSTR